MRRQATRESLRMANTVVAVEVVVVAVVTVAVAVNAVVATESRANTGPALVAVEVADVVKAVIGPRANAVEASEEKGEAAVVVNAVVKAVEVVKAAVNAVTTMTGQRPKVNTVAAEAAVETAPSVIALITQPLLKVVRPDPNVKAEARTTESTATRESPVRNIIPWTASQALALANTTRERVATVKAVTADPAMTTLPSSKVKRRKSKKVPKVPLKKRKR